MGLLDDAIREHLELKRLRGAEPGEISRLEREALGPVGLGAEPRGGAPPVSDDLVAGDEPAGAPLLGGEAAGYPPADEAEGSLHPTGGEPLPAEEPLPFDEPSSATHPPPAEDTRQVGPFAAGTPSGYVPESVVPPAGPGTHGADVVDADVPPDPGHAPPVDEETAEWETLSADEPHDLGFDDPASAEPPAATPAPAPAPSRDPAAEEPAEPGRPGPEGGDEDVLEETPDFLQETPEHDRLWFEQQPPRDFDFDK